MADNDNDKGLGLGTAAGVAVTTAVGTPLVALADGAFATREAGVKASETKVKDAAKALHEAWGADKIKDLKLDTAEQGLFDAHIKPLVTHSTEALPLTHSHASSVLETFKKTASDADKKVLDSLLGKLKPLEQAEKTIEKAGLNHALTGSLSERWKDISWLERIEGSIMRSPKKIAIVAAPLIAAGAFLGINYLSSGQKAELNGNSNGQAKT